ncbi:MAG TPA: hypothetical protein VGM77_06655 [Gemmatimonadales bacterium]
MVQAVAARTARTLVILGAIALAGCTSTSLVNMWKDPNYPRQPLHNVLVVTLRKSASARRMWEDGFVTALRQHGISATPSYTYFPSEAPDTAELTATVRDKGFDAVFVAHELSATTETRYVPGYLSTEPVSYVSPWTGHYYTYFSQVYAPSYVEADRVVRYESEIWQTRGAGRLVWSGTTESINPQSAAQINAEITDVIVPALARSGVLVTH